MDEPLASPTTYAPTHEDDESDVTALARTIWGHKFLVAFICAVSVGAAVYLAVTTPQTYLAELVVTPVSDQTSKMEGVASELGALTSLVGVNLSGANNQGEEAAAILDSRNLVEDLVKRDDLLPVLSRRAGKQLTLWRAVKDFKEGALTIRKDTRRGITTVGVVWTDPVVAARWATDLVALANEVIRARAIDNATRDIAYLNRQIQQTNSLELQQALYDIIKSETKTLMLANGRRDYAFEVVDPAVPPELKVGPHRLLIVLGGLGGGLLIGTVLALLIDWVRRFKHSAVRAR
jgi:uncharacterized protein involved in exopolysaccharide biosynthesis